ncbi:MAG: Gx transporter family protein [Roseburia sp.]|nr:Gx transporter family protein [Roseburia sp.]
MNRDGWEGRTTGVAKRVAYSAMLTALAMIFSYIETLIPLSVGIPGIKLGLANLVVLLGFYFLKPMQVAEVSVLRIVLTAALFGNVASLAYSLAGGILSFLVMLLLCKRCRGFSPVGVSAAGGVSHNIGQLLAAVCIVGSASVLYYLPILMLAGLAAGVLIGVVGTYVRKHLERFIVS